MKKLILLSFILISANCSESKAQMQLSLSEAITISLQNNFQILITKSNTEIANNNNKWGQAGLYPVLSFNVSNNNSIVNQDNPASFINGEYTNKTYRGNLDLNWTVFQGFKVWITKDKLQLLEEQSLGNASIIIENTIQAVILAYNTALLENEKLNVVNHTLSLSRDRYNYITVKKEMGTASSFDLLQVKNAMLQDSSNFVMQQFNYRNSIRNLNLLLAQDIETVLNLTDSLLPVAAIYDFQNLKQKMLSNNYSLKNQYINQELIRKEALLIYSSLYPKISLNTGANISGNKFQLENYDPRTGSSNDYYLNFALNFNLFTGGRAITAIKNAKIQENIAKLSVNDLELKMSNQLLSLIDLFNSRQTLYVISMENVTSAKMNLELAQEKFKNGTISSFEYRDIQVQYFNIAQNNLSVLYSLIDSNTELLRITGGILAVDN